MESYRKFAAVVLWMTAVIFIGANIRMYHTAQDSQERMYRVEIARLVKEIQKNGFQSQDLSDFEHIYHVECRTEIDLTASDTVRQFFEQTDSDHCFRLINGVLYRFDYTMQSAYTYRNMAKAVNVSLAVMSLLLICVLLYIRQTMIKPFEAMKDIPYELSKGRLAVPLPQNKSRFFGRFLWGIDLLRENMEERKRRELKLQRAQKTLVLSVSHDIKTPLSAIKLYAKVISRNLYEDDEQLKKIAENMEAKADEIGGFVTQMIKASGEDFLNIEVGKDGFYLSQLVKNIAGYYEDKLKLLHTDFIIEPYVERLLKGDFDRSVEVLQNMMENAIKYGDGTGIALKFGEEEDCVLVTVQNSGNTLPESELLHIFDSFWRGSNVQNNAGSGLGLYICRSLMHRMDGDIFAYIQDGDMYVSAVFRK